MVGSSLFRSALLRGSMATLLSVFAWYTTSAQVITIFDQYVETCSGTLYDSGGESGTGFGPGEDFTLILCPSEVGSAIRIDWTTFEMAGTDHIDVHNGASLADPLLITLDQNNLGAPVSIPFGSATGCMTLHFISDAVSQGGAFVGIVSCYVPCEPPVAIANMGMVSPAMVCMGEPITFDASASTASAGTSIAEYRWFFADGTVDSLSGAIATHAYSAPGAYTARLVLTDNSTSGCESTNPIDLQLLVGTAPDFTALVLDTITICQGESVLLDATGVQAVPWSGAPIVDFGGPVYVPDELNTPFVSEITFTGFEPGTSLTSVDLLQSICVSMEHSYLGDLDIILRCPNGQSVSMVEYPGGGTTHIGNPLDDGGDDGEPGECLDYCWTPNATNGTFEESGIGGVTPNVQPSTLTAGSTIIPGDYTSEQPLDQLVGCPLNGTWMLTLVDHLGSDDGFICSWSVTFDPSLYPDLVEFTPALGLSTTDSSSWSGPGVVLDPQNPLLATATPTAEGTFDYIFTVTDNFGCSYDTMMTVVVNPGIVAPVLITGDAQFCDGGIAYLNAPAGYTSYEWSNGSVGANISVFEPGVYTVTVYSGDCSLPSEPFTVTSAPLIVPVIQGPPSSCGGEPAVLSTTEEYASYQWSNASTDPSISVGTGTYTVTVTSAEGCTVTSAPYPVTIGSDPQAAFSVDPPSPQNIGATPVFTDASQGNGSPIISWLWELGILGEVATTPNATYTYTTPGNYTVTLTVTAADGCEDAISMSYVILPESIIIPNVFTPNNDSNNDFFVIENGQFYKNTLSVFNRWGQPVYEANNYQNAWNGSGVPDGTYYYVFKTLDDNKEYTGHVTILR